MENRRPVAMMLGLLAALLVIIAGKACTSTLDAPQKNGSKTAATGSTAQKSTSSLGLMPDPGFEQQDPPPEMLTEAPTEEVIYYEEVTDENGEVIGTIAAEPPTEEISLSMAEAYQKQHEENKKNKISGYYHESEDETDPAPDPNVSDDIPAEYTNATFPSDFVIYVG